MVRIGTWNLENFAQPGAVSGAPDDRASYDAKIENLASNIIRLAPHVLGVQEVGDPEALDDLAVRLPGTWQTALAAPDERGIRVGLLSRLPLTEIEEVSRFPAGVRAVQVDDHGGVIDRLGRPALRGRVCVDHGHRMIDVISLHLKSKLLSFAAGRFVPEDQDERARYALYASNRRAAEAAAVRCYVTELLSREIRTGVAVVGDLNDELQAASTQILLGPPASEAGTPGDEPPGVQGQRLWNCAGFITESDRWTRLYRGRRELIDHVLCSAEFAGSISTAAVGPGQVSSIADLPAERRNDLISDHRAVVVDFDV